MLKKISLAATLVLSQLSIGNDQASAQHVAPAKNAAFAASLVGLQANQERYTKHRDSLLSILRNLSRPQRIQGAVAVYLSQDPQNKADLPGLDTNLNRRFQNLSDSELRNNWESIFEEELKKAYRQGSGPPTPLSDSKPPADTTPTDATPPPTQTTLRRRSNRIHKWAILNLFGRRKPCK